MFHAAQIYVGKLIYLNIHFYHLAESQYVIVLFSLCLPPVCSTLSDLSDFYMNSIHSYSYLSEPRSGMDKVWELSSRWRSDGDVKA
jgi:hypothetical protein